MKKKKQNKANGAVQVGRYNVFCQYAKRHLRKLPINALDEEIFSSDGATFKLDNQKNVWKVVRAYQEHN